MTSHAPDGDGGSAAKNEKIQQLKSRYRNSLSSESAPPTAPPPPAAQDECDESLSDGEGSAHQVLKAAQMRLRSAGSTRSLGRDSSPRSGRGLELHDPSPRSLRSGSDSSAEVRAAGSPQMNGQHDSRRSSAMLNVLRDHGSAHGSPRTTRPSVVGFPDEDGSPDTSPRLNGAVLNASLRSRGSNASMRSKRDSLHSNDGSPRMSGAGDSFSSTSRNFTPYDASSSPSTVIKSVAAKRQSSDVRGEDVPWLRIGAPATETDMEEAPKAKPTPPLPVASSSSASTRPPELALGSLSSPQTAEDRSSDSAFASSPTGRPTLSSRNSSPTLHAFRNKLKPVQTSESEVERMGSLECEPGEFDVPAPSGGTAEDTRAPEGGGAWSENGTLSFAKKLKQNQAMLQQARIKPEPNTARAIKVIGEDSSPAVAQTPMPIRKSDTDKRKEALLKKAATPRASSNPHGGAPGLGPAPPLLAPGGRRRTPATKPPSTGQVASPEVLPSMGATTSVVAQQGHEARAPPQPRGRRSGSVDGGLAPGAFTTSSHLSVASIGGSSASSGGCGTSSMDLGAPVAPKKAVLSVTVPRPPPHRNPQQPTAPSAPQGVVSPRARASIPLTPRENFAPAEAVKSPPNVPMPPRPRDAHQQNSSPRHQHLLGRRASVERDGAPPQPRPPVPPRSPAPSGSGSPAGSPGRRMNGVRESQIVSENVESLLLQTEFQLTRD
eukprot:TRINITY_DN10397_c0_g1_i1.p1 TRINITY_DN10397_c0_g1~~TRINITY_DN10397_c0_g1_i1.p1  ORF type:complete len:718 (+),score=173.71 TRINITY_DN10397_c0_g1_i1:107-2260(+)